MLLRFLLVACAALAPLACAVDARQRCEDGYVCAASMVCAPRGGGCVTLEQLETCAGRDDGSECRYAGVPLGTCLDQVCRGVACGNSILEPGERCDDGNTIAGDGCSATCDSDERCGNGVLDLGEDCDCGDGSVPAPPHCATSNHDRSGLCNTFCQRNCGDGMLDEGETCDIGVIVSDGQSEPTCGSFGFDRGRLRCSGLCGVDTSACERMGWRAFGIGAGGIQPDPFGQPSLVLATWVSPDDTMWFVTNSPWVVSRRPGEAAVLHNTNDTNLAISGTASGAIFAVGPLGRIVEIGTTWATHASPTSEHLRGVWAIDDEQVVAVGEAGTIVRYNGLFWSLQVVPTTATLRAVHGASSSDVVVVGDGGTIVRFDGIAWQLEASPTAADLHAVWAAGGELFVVGDGGTILRRTASGWIQLPSGTSADLYTVWGRAGDDVFIGGFGGTLLHYDGMTMRRLEASVPLDVLSIRGNDSVVIAAGTDIELALSYEGSTWVTDTSPVTATLRAVAAIPDGGFIAAGDGGAILRSDALGWSTMPSPTTAALHGIWVHDADTMVAVGASGTILMLVGGAWTAVPSNTTATLRAVWGTGPGEIFAIGDGTILRFDGSAWSTQLTSPGLALTSVWGSSSDHVVAVGAALGGGVVLRYDGATWVVDPRYVATTGHVNAVWAHADRVLIATAPGELLLDDGSSWIHVGRVARAAAISGTGSTDVFVAGARSTAFDPVRSAPVFHHDGAYVGPSYLSALSFVDSDTRVDLHGIAATPRTTVFVGADGTIRTLLRSTPWGLP